MHLSPMHLTVAKLLDGRLFRIPSYQRAYSWGKNQRSDLFRDIEEAHRSGLDHFMATVVALGREKVTIGADEYQIVDLVDGQQRLTTLVILLKAVELALASDEPAQSKAKATLTDLLVKSDEHNLVLLQTNHDASHVFTDYIRTGALDAASLNTAADKHVADAVAECERFVAAWRDRAPLLDLVGTVRNRMSMILHQVEDPSIVYRVFEVLNSRGLDVKWIDKLKSQLMASIYEHVPPGTREQGLAEMHVIWQDIYRTVGLKQDHADEALQFAGTLVRANPSKRVLSDEDAARELQRFGGKSLATIIQAGRLLERVNRHVHAIHDDVRRRAVTKVLHARFVAVAIMLRSFEPALERALLEQWERVTFRLFGIGKLDARSYIGEYVRLGGDIFAETAGPAEIAERLSALSQHFDVAEVMDERGYWDDWYWRREETRYVLHRYDEWLARRAGSAPINASEWNKIWSTDPSKSIEHVMPQHTERRYVHNLGNLVMLEPVLNSSLGGKAPAEKAASYVDCGLKGTAEVGRTIRSNGRWDRASVEERCKGLAKFFLDEWGG